MKELTIEARIENMDEVLDFVNSELEKHNCPLDVLMQISIAVEEIYVNIAHYAYNPKYGYATIICAIEDDPLSVTVQFQDNGTPYNPLEKADPDITLSAEERDIGGLGIFIVKKQMDDIEYKFENGKNILTFKKKF